MTMTKRERVSAGVAALVALGVSAGWGTPAQAWPREAPCAIRTAQLEHHKRTVVAFYTLAFNDGQAAEAVERYVGVDANGEKTYTQHNPQAVDGPAGFIEFVTGFKAAYPEANVEILRVIAEGDLVVTHSHFTLSPDDRGSAAVDIFRLDARGKVVEHWDVIQTIPEAASNDNGMF